MALSNQIKALLAGVSGTALQWYDFAIFGYFAPIIATTFFPHKNHLASILHTFAIFAVSYLLAPLGAIAFGYIGDRYGRKKALTLSILAMAIPTALISVIPGYQAIGVAAPLLITLLRVMQGFVASAEFTGASIFLIEHAKPTNKAFYGCLTSSAYSAGSVLAGLAASFFTSSFMPAWGWRLGFALALLAGLVIFFLRLHVHETPEYTHIKADEKPRVPLMIAIREKPWQMLGVMGLAWLTGIMTFGTYVFTATYLHTYFNLPLSLVTLIITAALVVDALLEPVVAVFADTIGHKTVIRLGMMCMIVVSIPVFYLLSSGNVVNITKGLIVMSIVIAITYAPMNAYMVSLFPRAYRYSGFGVAFNVSISIFGSTTPLFLMWLVSKTGNFIAPAGYYIFGAVIGLLSLAICQRGLSWMDNLQPSRAQ